MHFDYFLQQACPPLDLQWRKYRRRAARHRLQARLAELGLEGWEEYLVRLASDPAEAALLPDLMRITVSRFFREAPLWTDLGQLVLPQLLATASRQRPLRAWSIACAGGEEPYSLALLWRHLLQGRHPRRSLGILASDLDLPSLVRARRARYGYSSLREVPVAIRERWFVAAEHDWRLLPSVAAAVHFRHHNFMDDPLPGVFNLVLARYLPFTYYRGRRRQLAARRLWQALRPGGALMIGAREQLLPEERQLFAPWSGTRGIYRRRHFG